MGHFYYNCADDKGLQEHLEFSREGSCEVDAAGLRDVSQHGDVNFSEDDDAGDRVVYYSQCCRGQVKEFWLAYYGEAYEGSADEDFVGEGVHYSTKFAGDTQFSCDGAIDHIRQAGDNKNDEGDIQKIRVGSLTVNAG